MWRGSLHLQQTKLIVSLFVQRLNNTHIFNRSIQVNYHPGGSPTGLRHLYRSLSLLTPIFFPLSNDPAARMESNGERNFIHCSQRTAELLIRAGKKHWITAREDKIEAKGKSSTVAALWLF
jgi:hypothetical protein